MAKAIRKTRMEKGVKPMTEQQIRIKQMRDELNKRDPNAVPVFTKYKNITYLANVLLPPYGLYRIWCKKSQFTATEKGVQTAVCIMVVLYFISFRYSF